MMCFIPIYLIGSSTELLFLTFPISPPSSKNMLFQISVPCIPLLSLCKSCKSIYNVVLFLPSWFGFTSALGCWYCTKKEREKSKTLKSCFVFLKGSGCALQDLYNTASEFNHSLFLHPPPLSASFCGCGTSLITRTLPSFQPYSCLNSC